MIHCSTHTAHTAGILKCRVWSRDFQFITTSIRNNINKLIVVVYPNWPQGDSLIPAQYPRKTTHAQKQIPTHNHKFRFSASDRIANSDIIRHYRIAFASWCHDDYYMGYGPSMVMASPQIFRSQLSCYAVLWSAGAPQFVHGAKRTQCGGEAILHILIYIYGGWIYNTILVVKLPIRLRQ